MTLLCGEAIEELVELLDARGARLFHACQLVDFQSYVRLGGVPSRGLLESTGSPYTAFASDANDKRNGVWSLVFGNLEDFGASFALGNWGQGPTSAVFVPTVYGPITIQLLPRCLLGADSVAVSLVSAGQPRFNRETHSLPSAAAVDACYYLGKKLKFTPQLAQENGLEYAIHPEWSLQMPDDIVPFGDVDLVRVEPIVIADIELRERAARIAEETDLRIFERDLFKPGRRDLLVALAQSAGAANMSVSRILKDKNATAELLEYANKIISSGELRKQFDRYQSYLRAGTFQPFEC